MKAFGVVILMAAFAFGFIGAQRVNTLRPGNLAPVNHIPDFAGVDVAEGAAPDDDGGVKGLLQFLRMV